MKPAPRRKSSPAWKIGITAIAANPIGTHAVALIAVVPEPASVSLLAIVGATL